MKLRVGIISIFQRIIIIIVKLYYETRLRIELVEILENININRAGILIN